MVEQFFFWQMKCQWMKIWLNKVWDTRKVLTNFFLMLNGHTCHRFVAWIWANESHPDRFIQLRTSVCKAPQTAKEGNQNVPVAALRPHTSPHWNSFTLKHSSDVNVSMCHTSAFGCQRFSGGIHFTMLNHILIHFERFHDIAENIRKREGAIATCSDTLTTASFPQSYSKSKTESQQLGTCQTWLLTLSSTDLSPLPCISRARNGFAGQKLSCRSGPAACWKQALGFGLGKRSLAWCVSWWSWFQSVQRFSEIHKGEFSGFWWFLLVALYCLHVHTHELIAVSKSNFGIFAMFCFGWRSLIQDTLISLNSRDISHIHHLSLIFSSVLSAMTYNARPFGIFKQERAWAWERVEHIHQYHQCCSFSSGICLASVCRHLVACDHVSSVQNPSWLFTKGVGHIKWLPKQNLESRKDA